ncbi:APC family permease [Actinotalea caeni]|uniref:APC family permease n=1 Tax=Actinotalea caeni TaxID=1348467 RepID=UPI001F04275B|nr:APC family permease [Actinotalea caeni]
MTGSAGRALARRLSTTDAVVVGLSAMLGAGVFAVWGPASAAAGDGLLVALALAGVVALCNATSSAQLATHHPASGGTYLFGRRVLGPWWGFLAGWGFVVGKTASCAAMALTFAAYLTPDPARQRLLGVLAVVALTAAGLRGITRTAQVARALLLVTLAGLVVVLVAGGASAPAAAAPLPAAPGWYGVLQAAGLVFFAFAGYARIATLAEEVRTPATIGRAVLVALGLVLALYAAVAVVLVRTLGAELPGTAAPLAALASETGLPAVGPVVVVAAAAAALGALLALLTGVGRTVLAMAREDDLPRPLAAVGERHRVPHRAQLVIGAAVLALVLLTDLRAAIGFSSFGVLLYYAVTNAAAFAQPREQRRWPRAVQAVGLLGCLVVLACLPLGSVVGGLAVLAVGVVHRLLRRRGQAPA